MRGLLLALAGLCIFVIVSAIGIKVTPEPLKDFDYMVIGSVATLAALLVLFVVHISTSKSSNVFFTRRKK
jgi:hypothetical protein